MKAEPPVTIAAPKAGNLATNGQSNIELFNKIRH
jgi:hypothetical protein